MASLLSEEGIAAGGLLTGPLGLKPFSPSLLLPGHPFLGVSDYRADLNRAVLRIGDFRGPAKRFLEVFAVEQKVSTQLLIRFGKRAKRGYRLAIPNTHRRCIGNGSKSINRCLLPRCELHCLQAFAKHKRLGMFCSQDLFPDSQRTLIHGRSLLVPGLPFLKDGKIVEGFRCLKVVLTQYALLDSQGTLVERFSVSVPPLLSIESCQSIAGMGHMWMLWSQLLFSDRKCALVEWLGLLVLPLLAKEFS